jgi:phage N-6-adenine-methyltransferase
MRHRTIRERGNVSLVGYSAKNHPQQTSRRGPRPEVDDRGTDPALFAKLDERFHFTVDVAASTANAKCERYYTFEDDGLSRSWTGERVWCNPPYSDIRPWVERAWYWTSLNPNPAFIVVMLLPANRTEQLWWQDWVEPHRDCGRGLTVEFMPGRPRFVAPGAESIGPNERPPFGCCLLIWES